MSLGRGDGRDITRADGCEKPSRSVNAGEMVPENMLCRRESVAKSEQEV